MNNALRNIVGYNLAGKGFLAADPDEENPLPRWKLDRAILHFIGETLISTEAGGDSQCYITAEEISQHLSLPVHVIRNRCERLTASGWLVHVYR